MKKVFFSLFTFIALTASVAFANAESKTKEFTIRFRENTMVVMATNMSEARLYNMEGKLLQKQVGNYALFEMEQGSYRLYAKVGDQMVVRRIEMR